MAGFPGKPSRTAFGPQMVDTAPVRDPRRHVPAKALNLLFWQVAGIGLTVPKMVVLAEVDAGGMTVATLAQALAWDPDGELPDVEWTYDGIGSYNWALDSGQYEDEEGNMVSLAWLGGMAIPLAAGTSGLPLVGLAQAVTQSEGVANFYRCTTGASEDPDAGLPRFLMAFW